MSIERYRIVIENMIEGLPYPAEIQINFRAIHRSVDEVKSDTINIARQILDAHPQVDNLEVQYSDGSVNARVDVAHDFQLVITSLHFT